jgi:UDP-N-acetyl-D-galactosamine dehydrogenase
LEDLRECSVFIIAVPTPIDEFKAPDLTPLIKASETVGQVLKAGDIVIGDGFQIRPRSGGDAEGQIYSCKNTF